MQDYIKVSSMLKSHRQSYRLWGDSMNKKQQKNEAPNAEGTISTRMEQKQVEERVAIGAHVVYETIRREGEEELSRTPSALAWSALAAGLSMGFLSLLKHCWQRAYPTNRGVV